AWIPSLFGSVTILVLRVPRRRPALRHRARGERRPYTRPRSRWHAAGIAGSVPWRSRRRSAEVLRSLARDAGLGVEHAWLCVRNLVLWSGEAGGWGAGMRRPRLRVGVRMRDARLRLRPWRGGDRWPCRRLGRGPHRLLLRHLQSQAARLGRDAARCPLALHALGGDLLHGPRLLPDLRPRLGVQGDSLDPLLLRCLRNRRQRFRLFDF